MQLILCRDAEPGSKHNFGKLFVDGQLLGETLEDPDRRLEEGGKKVQDDTAIPRGSYRVIVSLSKRFGRQMPEVQGVPQFSGVRIHGGNTEHDTHGCPLLGSVRTDDGIKDCSMPNARLMTFLMSALTRGEEITLEVV